MCIRCGPTTEDILMSAIRHWIRTYCMLLLVFDYGEQCLFVVGVSCDTSYCFSVCAWYIFLERISFTIFFVRVFSSLHACYVIKIFLVSPEFLLSIPNEYISFDNAWQWSQWTDIEKHIFHEFVCSSASSWILSFETLTLGHNRFYGCQAQSVSNCYPEFHICAGNRCSISLWVRHRVRRKNAKSYVLRIGEPCSQKLHCSPTQLKTVA